MKIMPRFGWFGVTHTAIRNTAIESLPEEIREFLKANEADMAIVDIEADWRKTTQEDHFIHSEMFRKEGEGPPLSTKRLFAHSAKELWDLAVKGLQQGENTDLTELDLEKIRKVDDQAPPGEIRVNVIKTIFTRLDHIIKLLKEGPKLIFENLKRSGVTVSPEKLADLYKTQLFQHIGQLTHFVADAHMPFHLSAYHSDWPLLPPQKDDGKPFNPKECIHAKSEEWFNNPEHLKTMDLASPFNSQELTTVTLPEDRHKGLDLIFKTLLEPSITRSFNSLRAIFQAHQASITQGEAGPQLNEAALIEKLTPIMREHIRAAQKATAELLLFAWQRAGSPDFKQLLAWQPSP